MSYEEILQMYLSKGEKPTRAVEKALEDYNNSRKLDKGICVRTAWRKYKKIKKCQWINKIIMLQWGCNWDR